MTHLACFAMYYCYIFWVTSQPAVNRVAGRPQHIDGWRMVIRESQITDLVVEFSVIVFSFTQIEDHVPIRVPGVEKPRNLHYISR